jgi:hypothetical protein
MRDEALFRDPPPKEDCPICFLPMPILLLAYISLPPATRSSVPISDYAEANEELATEPMEKYYPCCGKSICAGCVYSFCESGNHGKCPFCKADHVDKTNEEMIKDLMKRVEANDAGAICKLATHNHDGRACFQQDHTKSMELYARAGQLGCSNAHHHLGNIYNKGGDMKKARFHFEAAAMAGHEMARLNLGTMEVFSGTMERAVKHWIIAASAGCYDAMHHLTICFEKGAISRESMDSTLADYNSSCAEMRSEARDAFISVIMEL